MTTSVSSAPRFIRLRDAPSYLGMDKNRFNRNVRPHLCAIPIGTQGIAFDRIDLDAWADEYKNRNGRPAASLTRSKPRETKERQAGGEEERDRKLAGPGRPVPAEHRGADRNPAAAEKHDRQREKCTRAITPAQPPVDGECAQQDAGAPQSPRQHKGRSAQGTVQYQPQFANCPDFTVL